MTSEYSISEGKQGSLGSSSMSKTQVNIHLDDDILEWFGIKENKADSNIQTSINHVLREHMLHHLDSSDQEKERIINDLLDFIIW